MPDDTPHPPPDQPTAGGRSHGWDPQAVIRERAAVTRTERDQAIAELREVMDDDEILDEFGINLDEIER